MKISLISFAAVTCFALVLSGNAFAIKRVETSNLQCSTVQNIVRSEGAVILRYPSKRVANYTLYDRYVANETFCKFGETVERQYIPASGTPSCPVFVCVEKILPFDRLFHD